MITLQCPGCNGIDMVPAKQDEEGDFRCKDCGRVVNFWQVRYAILASDWVPSPYRRSVATVEASSRTAPASNGTEGEG